MTAVQDPGELRKIDPWVRDILVDPLGKSPLRWTDQAIFSDFGRQYPVVHGIPDFRPMSAGRFQHDDRTWKKGQDQFESWDFHRDRDDRVDFMAECESVRHVYSQLPLEGTVLDVGGHQGRARAFLLPDQPYVIIDPFLAAFDGLAERDHLLKAYPFLLQPVNFICGVAEHLPFRSGTYSTVHMRSVIDHFVNPALALEEAYRVLEPRGQIIIGILVDGGKSGRRSLKDSMKEAVRAALPMIGITRYADHHVWHPTYRDLCDLISAVGFIIDQTVWQQGIADVCYVRARKPAQATLLRSL